MLPVLLIIFYVFSGSFYVQCCARFLLVKCQLTVATQNADKSRRENGNSLLGAVHMIPE